MSGVENYNKLLIKFSSNNSNYLGRQFGDKKNLYRSFYQRDRDRIIHSTSFRRLKYKTQVFVYDEGDHYRTRLTHTLEVSQISRSISRYLKLNEDLSEAISLAHDLGHPPFGHAGEKILDYCIRNHGGFNHNIHSIRLVTELEKAYQNFDGLNLSINTIDGIVKHNGPNYLIKKNLDLLPNLNKIKKINFYKVNPNDTGIHKLAELVLQGTIETKKVVLGLRNMKNIKEMTEAMIKVNSIENQADDVFDMSIEKLFEQENDFKEVIKKREIYQVLEIATDKIEDVSNVIESIIIKYA
mgnify:CR=1 FL=1